MIYITGHRGLLGSQLMLHGAVPYDYQAKHGDVVINALAKTDHNECEKDPLRAYASNVEFLQALLWDSRDLNFNVIHISTDYVFDGTKENHYIETDPICPVNSVYARTKAAGEIAFLSLASNNSTMVRTSWLFGPGRKAWFDYPQIWKQKGSPTYTPDLAKCLINIANRSLNETVPKILHYATSPIVSRAFVAALAGNENFTNVDTPPGKPYNSALRTSDWILEKHRQPRLTECITDYRGYKDDHFGETSTI